MGSLPSRCETDSSGYVITQHNTVQTDVNEIEN